MPTLRGGLNETYSLTIRSRCREAVDATVSGEVAFLFAQRPWAGVVGGVLVTLIILIALWGSHSGPG